MTPDFTWMNTDSDGIHYTYASKWLYPSHKTSAPLYLLTQHFMLKIPVGTDAWRMVILSVIGSLISCIFVYLICKHYTKNKVLSALSVLGFGGSVLVISQTTIIETYSLITMASVGTLYFSIVGKYKLSALMLGIGLAIHPLVLLAGIPIIIKYKGMRHWKPLLITGIFLLFYIYIPITNRPPYMWIEGQGTKSIIGWISDNFNTVIMLVGGIAIYDIPKRILETNAILLVSTSVYLIFAAFTFNIKSNKFLLILSLLPVILFVTNLAPQTYVYMMPSIAYIVIAGTVGIDSLIKVKLLSQRVVPLLAIYLLLITVTNFSMFDLGNTLDPNNSAGEFVRIELPKVTGENAILVPKQDWEWASTFYYNREYKQNIKAVCVGSLASDNYRNQLRNEGIKLLDYKEVEIGRTDLIAQSIIDLNDNVFTTVTTTANTYGAMVVKATSENSPFINKKYPSKKELTTWKFIPDSPISMITGSIEVEKWVNFNQSNRSALILGMLGFIGFAPSWFAYQIVVKKKEWKFSNVKEKLARNK